jgi:hypothetical protein
MSHSIHRLLVVLLHGAYSLIHQTVQTLHFLLNSHIVAVLYDFPGPHHILNTVPQSEQKSATGLTVEEHGTDRIQCFPHVMQLFELFNLSDIRLGGHVDFEQAHILGVGVQHVVYDRLIPTVHLNCLQFLDFLLVFRGHGALVVLAVSGLHVVGVKFNHKCVKDIFVQEIPFSLFLKLCVSLPNVHVIR